jgi:hypothetical protein
MQSDFAHINRVSMMGELTASRPGAPLSSSTAKAAQKNAHLALPASQWIKPETAGQQAIGDRGPTEDRLQEQDHITSIEKVALEGSPFHPQPRWQTASARRTRSFDEIAVLVPLPGPYHLDDDLVVVADIAVGARYRSGLATFRDQVLLDGGSVGGRRKEGPPSTLRRAFGPKEAQSSGLTGFSTQSRAASSINRDVEFQSVLRDIERYTKQYPMIWARSLSLRKNIKASQISII